MGKAIDMTGRIFPTFTILAREGGGGHCKQARWRCRCQCGKEFVADGADLRRGKVTSCGCITRQKRIERKTTHGMSRSWIYRLWSNEKKRCTCPTDKDWPRYGGRGIIMCPEWVMSFKAYYAHVSTLPHFGEKGYTLNRIDNDGPYAPGNVEWATHKTQANNRTNNRFITWQEETHTLAEWEEITGINQMTISTRIKRGMSINESLSRPVRAWRRHNNM